MNTKFRGELNTEGRGLDWPGGCAGHLLHRGRSDHHPTHVALYDGKVRIGQGRPLDIALRNDRKDAALRLTKEKPQPGMTPNWGFSLCYHSRPMRYEDFYPRLVSC